MMRSALERCVGKTNLKYKNTLEGFPSGQREQTVNLPALPSMVRIRPPPPYSLGNSSQSYVLRASYNGYYLSLPS